MARREEIRSLTGLRGVAACYVMAYHFFQSAAVTGPVRTLLLHGYLAVDLFFVLSGFVIAMIYGERFAGTVTRASFGDFLLRRVGRVYPLYAVVTALIAALTFAGVLSDAPPTPLAMVTNALMIQAWGFAGSIAGTTWSISTELAAYLLFPVIAMLMLRGSGARLAAMMALAAAVLVGVSLVSTEAAGQTYDGGPLRNGPLDLFGAGTIFPLARCLAGFCLGVGAFRAEVTIGLRLGWMADVFALAVVGLLCVAGSDVAVVLACVPLVIALGAGNGSVTARVLGWGPVYWLGLVSYSVYLTHRLVDALAFEPIFGVVRDFGLPHAFSIARVIVLAVVLAVSAATYALIETPARDAIRRLTRGRARAAA